MILNFIFEQNDLNSAELLFSRLYHLMSTHTKVGTLFLFFLDPWITKDGSIAKVAVAYDFSNKKHFHSSYIFLVALSHTMYFVLFL